MSDAKFNKNWKYTVSRNGRHQISEIGGGNVCMLWNCPARGRNAHLIAASPEMYGLLSNIKQCIENGHPFEEMVGRIQDFCDEINETLAKARGEHV